MKGSQQIVPTRSRGSMPIFQTVPTSIKDTTQERQTFHMFAHICHSVGEVAETSDLEMFAQVIPRACHHVTALRQAVMCLTAFVASISDPSQQDKHYLFCEYQYMKVIQSMAESQVTSVNWVETILVCLLLVTLEAHRNDFSRAITHLKAGVALFREHQFTPQAASMEVALRRVLERFYIQLLSVGQNEQVSLETNRASDSVYVHVDLNQAVYELCQNLQAFRTSPVSDQRRLQQECLQILDENIAHFQSMTLHQCKGRDQYRDAYLTIQYQTCRLVLLNTHKDRFQMFKGCNEDFQTLLDACRHYSDVNSRREEAVADSFRRPIRFGYATEFIMNVFFIACECHSLSIRKSAITFLRQCYRREKSWDSFHAASIAEWLLKREDRLRSLTDCDEQVETNHLILEYVQLHKEDEYRTLSSFRRPSWALVGVESRHGITEHWVHLGGPELESSTSTETAPQTPPNQKLCYQFHRPVWPSTARMIGQTCLYGVLKREFG